MGVNAAFQMSAGGFEVSGTGRRDGNSEDCDLVLGCRTALLFHQPSVQTSLQSKDKSRTGALSSFSATFISKPLDGLQLHINNAGKTSSL